MRIAAWGALAMTVVTSAPGQRGPAPLPADLVAYLTKYVKLDANARAQLLAGAPVTKLLDSDPSKEVAVFGAVWVKAPIERYLASIADIEQFESGGGFRITEKVSSPPQLSDFAQLSLSDEDVKDLKSCRVSQCEVKLAASAIERMRREIDWSSPDAREQVNRLARQLALDYVTEYLKGGNDALAVYRDADRPTFVAREFETLVDGMPAITEFLPNLRQYLLDFPRAVLPGSTSFVYWQDADFGLKPTIRITHLVMAHDPDGAVVASKMLYATHYFWTALEVRALIRDPSRGPGFWLVTESRSRSDGLSGFVGRVIRGKVRSAAQKGTESLLEFTKRTMERGTAAGPDHGRDERDSAGAAVQSRIALATTSQPALWFSMPTIRDASLADLPALTDIYNHYIVHTPITFDVVPYTVDQRREWFDDHAPAGKYRLLVADEHGALLGYATTSRWRPKAAYGTTVESSVYCRHDACGRGIGSKLYRALFEAIRSEDVHMIVAGATMPNAASVALHERLGFRQVGVFSAVGRKFDQFWDVAWFERPLRM